MPSEQRAERFFDNNRWLLIFIGVWPRENQKGLKKILNNSFRMFIMVSIPCAVLAEWIGIKDYTGSNIFDTAIIFTVSVAHSLSTIKGICISYKKESFYTLFEALESKVIRYEPCEEKGYFPKVLTMKCRRNAKLLRNIYFGFLWSTATAAFIPSVLQLIKMAFDSQNNALPEMLPISTWVPFSSNTAATFIAGALFQAYPAFFFAFG